MALKIGGGEKNPVTKLIGPGTTGSDQTLYERIGGEAPLDRIVTGVYDAMKADKEIGKFFARFRLEKLKERTVDYLRGEWGGDQYKGSDLWIAHSHLGVNNHQYDIMMKYYVKMLKKERIGKKETAECLESLEKMRFPCVDRDLKLKNMYLKHADQLAAKAGGDGWGTVAATQAERDAKEKATLELLEKNKLEEMKREEARKAKIFEEQQALARAKAASPAAAARSASPKAKAKAKAAPAPAAADAPAAVARAAPGPTAAPAGGEPAPKAKAKAKARAAPKPVTEEPPTEEDGKRTPDASTKASSSGELQAMPKASAEVKKTKKKEAEEAKVPVAYNFSPAADNPPDVLPQAVLIGALSCAMWQRAAGEPLGSRGGMALMSL